MAWTGFGWTWAGLGDERAFPARVWSVVAGVLDGDRVSQCGGVVVAADLDLAAEQLCAYLDGDLVDDGSCYLFASRGPLDPHQRGARSPTRLFSVVRRDRHGALIPGDWRVADDSVATWGVQR
ncbi:hypothetical protein [Nocardia concava]|uniref:hypothetical protein n=1 Tax=Nocardia concava TaxID=257281 RepID=UPI000306A9A8|nr:hypothetical protein [Nocardia concava]